jgi:hypothetical protein
MYKIFLSVLLLVILIPSGANMQLMRIKDSKPTDKLMINWKPYFTPDRYIPLVIETPETTEDISITKCTLIIENDGQTELTCYPSEILLLKKNVNVDEFLSPSKKKKAKWYTVYKAMNTGEENEKQVNIPVDECAQIEYNIYDYYSKLETGYYAFVVFCKDANGKITLAVSDFRFDSFDLSDGTCFEFIRPNYLKWNGDILFENSIQINTEFDEYPPNISEVKLTYNELSYSGVGISKKWRLLKKINDIWYVVYAEPYLDFSIPLEDPPKSTLMNDITVDLSPYMYHDFTDGQYALCDDISLSNEGKLSLGHLCEFSINSLITEPTV